MAIYAIGDIQGCYDDLQQLLKKISFNSDRDKLWFTGDLVNRGPKSLETLRYIHSLGDNAIVVLGNHDLHLLATVFHHEKPGKKDTIHDVLEAPDRDLLMEWLIHRPLIHVDKETNMTMVHAGLHPDWSIDKASSLAREVEQVLQSNKHHHFFKHMYGDKPHMWSEDLQGWARLRYITNILTRLRYCNAKGEIALGIKGVPGTQPEGLHPWFEIETRASREDHIIFGHWSTLVLAKNTTFENVYPLDTGCLWGGELVAMRIDTENHELARINCPGSSKPASFS